MKRLWLSLSAAALIALPMTAQAYWAQVVGDLNLRACASTSCARLTVLPRGATVWVNAVVGGWDHITYGGLTGYAAGNYIVAGYVGTPPIAAAPYPTFPPPTFGFYTTPRWDPRYGAWFDGRRWFFAGRWYDRPSGFWFSFRFGG